MSIRIKDIHIPGQKVTRNALTSVMYTVIYHGMANNKHEDVFELALDAGDVTFHILAILIDTVDFCSFTARSAESR